MEYYVVIKDGIGINLGAWGEFYDLSILQEFLFVVVIADA
jgi:hypothetical protein